MSKGNQSRKYRSSIPWKAKERIAERYPNGAKKKCEYRVGRKLVGVRLISDKGEPEMEWGVKNGEMHGRLLELSSGTLVFVEPYKNGVAHGTAYQWDENGRLLGTYRMNHGTGIDLWRQDWGRKIFLHEVHYMKDGMPHGWEWWISDDQHSVSDETHWHEGKRHGIQRSWTKSRMDRGFPKYWIRDKQVTRRDYLKACAKDPNLPPYRKEDNSPRRIFPPEIQMHLNLPSRSRNAKPRKSQ